MEGTKEIKTKKDISDLVSNKPWLDYTSLSMLMACPRRYYWRVVRELTTTDGSPALLNGQAYHEALSTYYKARQSGIDFEEAVDLAIKSCLPIMKKIEVEDKKRNLTVAYGTLTNYFNYWRDEAYETVDVEIQFAVDLLNFMYVGRIDRLSKHPSFGKLVIESKTAGVWPPTWKSTKNRWEIKGQPNSQLDGYIAAIFISTGEMPNGGVLDVIPVYEKLTEPPFRVLTFRKEEDIEIWMDNIQEWWITLLRYRDSDLYPCNTDNCVPIYGGFECDYRELCKTIPHPHKMLDTPIPSRFIKEPWLPFSELGGIK